MWKKTKNILTPTYVTVGNEKNDLHFYITGIDERSVEVVSNAVEEVMNIGKKSPDIKKNIVLDEVVILQNGVRVGVAGQVKKIKKESSNDEYVNNDRLELLREFLNKI
jgi:hypothetical protein